MPITLAYWKIRGLAQPIRLMLAYCGEEFVDKFYECGDGPEFNRDCWLEEKQTLGLKFPNLPYLVDGDVKITQSNAILRHIGRKHDLCGKTEEERVRVDILADQSMDFRNGLIILVYRTYDTNLQNYMNALPEKLKAFEDFIGTNKWFAGDDITFVDFPMYELLDQHRVMSKDCLKEFPKLTAFLKRFEELPAIKKYMSSSKFMKAPINNKMAKFGAE